jgi:hypothetical protein
MRGGYEGMSRPVDRIFLEFMGNYNLTKNSAYIVTSAMRAARYAIISREFDTSSCFARVVKPTSCGFQARKRLPWDKFP